MIALGSDQGGFEVKQEIIAYLEKNQIAYKDFGSYDTKCKIGGKSSSER